MKRKTLYSINVPITTEDVLSLLDNYGLAQTQENIDKVMSSKVFQATEEAFIHQLQEEMEYIFGDIEDESKYEEANR